MQILAWILFVKCILLIVVNLLLILMSDVTKERVRCFVGIIQLTLEFVFIYWYLFLM